MQTVVWPQIPTAGSLPGVWFHRERSSEPPRNLLFTTTATSQGNAQKVSHWPPSLEVVSTLRLQPCPRPGSQECPSHSYPQGSSFTALRLCWEQKGTVLFHPSHLALLGSQHSAPQDVRCPRCPLTPAPVCVSRSSSM